MRRLLAAAAALTLMGAAAPASEFTYTFTRQTSTFYQEHNSGFADPQEQGRDLGEQGVNAGLRTKTDKGYVKVTIVQALPDNTMLVNVEQKSNEGGEVFPVLVTLPPDGALNFDRMAPVTEEERTLLHFFSPKFMPDNTPVGGKWQVPSLYPGERDVANYRLIKIDGNTASIDFDRTVEAQALRQNKVEAHGRLTYDMKARLPLTVHADFMMTGGGSNDKTTLDYTRQ